MSIKPTLWSCYQKSTHRIKLFHRPFYSEIIVYEILPLGCQLLHEVRCRIFYIWHHVSAQKCRFLEP